MNTTIWERSGGGRVPRVNQAYYAPTTFTYPDDEKRMAFIGYDALSNPSQAQATLDNINALSPTLTPMTLISNGSRALMICQPVETLLGGELLDRGIVCMTFKVGVVFQIFLNPSYENVGISLAETTAAGNESMIWDNLKSEMRYQSEDVHRLSFPIVNKEWELSCFPTEHFKDSSIPGTYLIFVVAVGVLFVPLACLVHRCVMALYRVLKENRRKDSDLYEFQQICDSLRSYSSIVVQLIPDAVLLLDRNGYIMGLNNQAISLLNVTPEEFLRNSIHVDEFFSQSTSSCCDSLHNRSPGVHELTVCRPRLKPLRVSANISPLFEDTPFFADMCTENIEFSGNADRNRVSQVILMRDISEQQRATEQLQKNKRDLTCMGEQRKEMLLFLCHELRNPIYVATSSLENMSSDTHDNAKAIVTASSYMQSLIDDILTYLDVDYSQEPNKEKALQEILTSVTNTIQPLAEEKQCSLSFQVSRNESPSKYLPIETVARLRMLLLDLSVLSIRSAQTGSVVPFNITFTNPSSSSKTADVFNLKITFTCADPIVLSDIISTSSNPFSLERVSKGAEFGGVGCKIAVIQKIVSSMRGMISVENETITVSIDVQSANTVLSSTASSPLTQK